MRFNQNYRFSFLQPGSWTFQSQLDNNFQELDQMQPFIRTITYSGPSYPSVTFGATHFICGTDGANKYDRATARPGTGTARSRVIGYTSDQITNGQEIQLKSYGVDTLGPTAWESGTTFPAPGEIIYLSATEDGKVTPNKPVNRRIEVGYALDSPDGSSVLIYICPRPYITGVATISSP